MLKLKSLFNRYKRSTFSFEKPEKFSDKFIFFYFLFFNFCKIPIVIKPILLLLTSFSKFKYKDLERIQNDRLLLKKNSKEIFKIKFKSISNSYDTKEKKDLFENGYVKITHFFKNIEVNKFVSIVEKLKAYNSQVPIQSNHIEATIDGSENYYSLKPDIKELEEFYENILSNKKLKEIVNYYLGGESKLYSINTMISIPSEKKHSVTNLHRDYEDIKFLKMMIYWTQTSYDDGSTCVIPGSHRINVDQNQNKKFLESEPGDIFIMDSYAYHSGNKNLKKKRITTWITFSRSQFNVASFDNKDYLFFDYFNKLWK